jgi:hypothetical protein
MSAGFEDEGKGAFRQHLTSEANEPQACELPQTPKLFLTLCASKSNVIAISASLEPSVVEWSREALVYSCLVSKMHSAPLSSGFCCV